MDKMDELGFVLSNLVIGTIQYFPILNTNFPLQMLCMGAVITAQAKMNSIGARESVYKALTKKKSPAAILFYNVEEEVLVYSVREKEYFDR